MSVNILGVSAFYHDSAAAIISDGKILAASQEERYSRRKGESGFPVKAVEHCLQEAGITAAQLDAVAYYDKPIQSFARLMQTYLEFPFKSWGSFKTSLPILVNEKLRIPTLIRNNIKGFSGDIYFCRHHESHAASSFFCSPFDSAAIIVADGVGEWACSSIGEGEGNSIRLIKESKFPHSLGLFYSAMTQYLGFKVNMDEYKVMGLAPYGEPKYAGILKENVVSLKEDGSLFLNLDYFAFTYGLMMITGKMAQLFGHPVRGGGDRVERFHMDVAASVQAITMEAMIRMARHARELTARKNLCLAGGVALNCVANGAIYREGIFENIYIQPAAGDAGGAAGAALQVWRQFMDKPRTIQGDLMNGSYLGPAVDAAEARKYFDGLGASYTEFAKEGLAAKIAGWISKGKVIGLCQGRMEFGPRALGARSILGDPRDANTQYRVNMKVKYRESFRPFAPAILEDRVREYFDISIPSPYMLMVMPINAEKRSGVEENQSKHGMEKLYVKRSDVPAVTHVDYSVRLQTVTAERNGFFHDIIKEFHRITGCPMIVNTSFNIRGEPIVADHVDAYHCFLMTDLDILVIENLVIAKPGVDIQ